MDLTDKTQHVSFGGLLSAEIALLFSVPQGSVLGPPLFLLYTAEVFDIIASLGLTGHSYSDVTQVYISAPAVTETQPTSARLAECIKHLNCWMSQNGLKLNAEKTQLVWLGTRQQLTKLTISQLPLSSSTVDLVLTVTNLGVVFDGQLTMAPHTASICGSGFFSNYAS